MWLHSTFPSRYHVTFRKEGVDWNYVSVSILIDSMVTFRKEGVDWNSFLFAFFFWYCKSPSARKVWIEIFIAQLNIQFAKRHLLQRRCGLKFGIALHTDILLPSPSARKVWIEITIAPAHRTDTTSPSVRKVWIEIPWPAPSPAATWVTFRKEGVDWNLC